MNTKPIIYILCGLPGSGKTTYAKQLENSNVIRLSLDEELFKLFGREFQPEQYLDFEKQTKDKLLEQAVSLVKENKSVILDWGFWKKDERKKIKSFLQDHDGEVKLLYFKLNPSELVKRVQNRDLSKNHEINAEMLAKFSAQFEELTDEGEEIVQHS